MPLSEVAADRPFTSDFATFSEAICDELLAEESCRDAALPPAAPVAAQSGPGSLYAREGLRITIFEYQGKFFKGFGPMV